ncbi:hypothetical protein EG347_08675 [Chryseobacterium sp. G0186]|uniref:hypothetical protein n=1 Tax=Chryseobacterium sp. G0186 TaxID=2487064 RepID=UPI000F4F8AC3|nr:hypothetical protein [Chryseobacterium sp. G0186]AZA77582.1 hypothetical protein EG347_08675 [Chryseobacterium sp. G0186]
MKTISLLLFFTTVIIGCKCTQPNDRSEKENTVISKEYHKSGQSDTDTLWVSQNDSTVFKKEEVLIQRPDSNPELSVRYELIKPKDNAYYFIYDDKKQLIKEGKYTSQYTYEGIIYKQGDFYNSKNYTYKKNGNLETIHYQEDGRNLKTEYFDSEKRLTKIRYLNKKSSDTEKIEIYKNGKLKETRIYKGFNSYDTVKADD